MQHRLLGNARYNRPELIHPRDMRNRLAGIFGIAWQTESLRAVEGNGEALVAGGVRVGAL